MQPFSLGFCGAIVVLSVTINLPVHICYMFYLPPVTEPHQEALTAVHQSAAKSLKQGDLTTVIVGITGSGKTTLLCRLFEEEPPEKYTSTGVADKSHRGLMHHLAEMNSWEFLSHNRILHLFAPHLSAEAPQALESKTSSKVEVSEPASNFSEDMTSHTHPPPPPPPSCPAAASASPTATQPQMSQSQIEKSPTSEAMVDIVRSRNVSKDDTILKLLHVVDTGGQPEFMEVMPCVMHNSHIIALVVNLAQSLDVCPPVTFHEDGKKFKRPYLPALSNRQIILQLIRTMQAKRSMNEESQQLKIMVIGTHRDCVWWQSRAIAAINRELKSILIPAFQNELILYRSLDEILFPVNSYKPNRDDKVIFEEIRRKITEASSGEEIDIPPSFFMLEQDIIAHAMQKGREMVSLDECLEMGSLLEMGPKVVQEALNYLHQHNIFLHFPEVLPHLVFTDPQAPLHFVRMIVAFSYKVLAGHYCGLPASYTVSIKNAIITEEMLQHESLSECFIQGIYQPQHAIELFTHLGVMSPLHESKSSDERSQIKQQTPDFDQPTPKPCSNRKFLMPCLLQDLTDFTNFLPQSSVAVFVVSFSHNCVPNGTFSGSLSRLLSTYGWKICSNTDGTPQCLAHNIATLQGPNMPAKITYVNTTQHFEIHVSCPNARRHAPTFSRIRNTIFSAIQTTFKVMKFKRVTIQDAFLCNCDCSKSTAHAAILCHSEQNFYLECSQTKDCYELNDTHTIWIKGQEGRNRGDFFYIYTLFSCVS